MDPLQNTDNNHPLQSQDYSLLADANSKERTRRRFKRGLPWLGTGIGLLGLSFITNILLFDVNSDFITYMYIMTTAGICMILKGMVDILGF
jgi:hypothetical protein